MPRSDLPGQLDHGLAIDTEGDLVRRIVAQPLKPTAPQKPCDLGLFDESKGAQIDLEDLLK